MKKMTPFIKKGAKSALAVALAATMMVPGTAFMAEDTPATDVPTTDGAVSGAAVEIPAPIFKMDFNEGLKEYYDNNHLEILKVEDVLIQKTEEEKEANDRFDANNILIQGTGSDAKYAKRTISNQPTTYYDAERGTVLYMGETKYLAPVIKKQSANITVDDNGTQKADEAATKRLDEEVPVATDEDGIVQDGMIISSGLQMDNPFAAAELSGETGSETTDYDGVTQPAWKEGLSMTYWIKVPTDDAGKAISGNALSWISGEESENGYGYMQIDNDSSILWTGDDTSVEDENDGNLFYMNSWKSAAATAEAVAVSAEATTNEAVLTGNAVVTTPDAVKYEDADIYANSPVSADNTANKNAGTWHQVAITIQNDWVEFYLDGKCVDVRSTYATLGTDKIGFDGSFKAFNYGTGLRYGFGAAEGGVNTEAAGKLITAWLCDEDNKFQIGGSSAMASAFGLADEASAIMLDDITFYDKLLTEEQIAAIYTADTTEEEPVATLHDVKSMKDMEGTAAASSVKKETIKGVSVDAIYVPENTKGSAKTGVVLENPFAGADMDGATIAYWTKQDPRSKGDATEKMPTPGLLIKDTEKYIYNEKSGAEGDAYSTLSVLSDGTTIFQEGASSNAVYGKLGNQYRSCFSVEDQAKYDVTDWYYVTLVMNNGGFTVYINGETYTNNALDEFGNSIAAGVRFCDGYYQREDDEKAVVTRYNVFGGSNNQFTTSLMTFLQYEDTDFYFGYLPVNAMMNEKTNPTYYAGIRTFETDLTAEQVKALYEDNTIYDGDVPTPPVEVLQGDANLDNNVTLDDANMVLKAALGIGEPLSGDAFTAADIDKNSNITLEDANSVLKLALGIPLA